MTKLKKIILILIKFCIIFLFFISIYHFINLKILKNDIAPVCGYTILEVASGSMQPTIEVGDLIIINTKDKNYKKNDIITFYDEDNNLVTHRIISISKNTIITKGDYNNTNDKGITPDKIIGKYIFKISSMGKILKILKNPLVTAIVLIISFLFCVLTSTDTNIAVDSIEEQEFQKYLFKKKNNLISDKLEEKEIRKNSRKKRSNTKKRKKRAKRKRQSRWVWWNIYYIVKNSEKIYTDGWECILE